MDRQSTVHYMVGIPGSGKSTLAEKIAEESQAKILSSDGLRKELTGSETDFTSIPHAEIFAELKRRATESIRNGEDFVYDVANLSSKFRCKDMQEWKDMGAKVKLYLMNVAKEIALERNSNRERVVPEAVIDRMHNTLFNEPLQEELKIADEIFIVDKDGKMEKFVDQAEGIGKEIGAIGSEMSFLGKLR